MHISNQTLPQSRLSKNATQAPHAPLPRFNPNSKIRIPNSAFTLLELLIAIGIIVLLVGILIPTVGKVRTAAKQADTRAQIAAIAAACENYYADFRAYPGPFSNQQLTDNTAQNSTSTFSAGLQARGDASNHPNSPTIPVAFPTPTFGISGTENLVLGLLGGLVVDTTTTPGTPRLVYDARLVGKGPNSLNVNNPKRTASYMDVNNLSLRVDDKAGPLKTGKWGDALLPLTGYAAGGCGDSIIPEFVDRYSDPMPLLYARATTGATSTGTSDTDNAIVTDGVIKGQYELNHFVPYTGAFNTSGSFIATFPPPATARSLGVGKRVPKYYESSTTAVDRTANPYHGLRSVTPNARLTLEGSTGTYIYPLDAFPYLRNPALSGASPNAAPNIARNKDSFILISAGTDRIYGTADDITNFGDVLP